ncbi:class I SAM-dependent methyltransferase [Streptomyces sp. NPDC006193]|uniref:class I SAM-dependent methyltransferase n=1 Tax=Streptomyces sp. NPDC006193 TaxID=3155717 RepID=UPI0033AE7947
MTAQNAHYNEKSAGVYEQMYPIGFDTDAAVEYCSGMLKPEAKVLESGIGTGRIALQMAERGFRPHGVDGSEAMLAKPAERDTEGLVTAVLGGGGRPVRVLEAFDASPYHVMTKPDFSMRYLNETAIMLDTMMVDRAQQLMVATHTIVDGGPPETTQHVIRCAFPLEIDLLAELSGLKLVERWAGWHQQPYTAISQRHVSAYERVT